MEKLFPNNVDPDQTLHYVASDLVCTVCQGLFCGFPGKNGLTFSVSLIPNNLKEKS